MVRKCGFFDCSNPAEKKNSACETCKERAERNICSACQQPEKQEGEVLKFKSSLIQKKYTYEFATLLRNKLSAPLQNKLLLPQLKLTASEQGLLSKTEKLLADFLAEKGGKQDHIDYFLLCSVCNPEFESKGQDFMKNFPQGETLWKGIEEKEEKFKEFVESFEAAVGEKELKRIGREAEEEWYKQIATKPDQNQPDRNTPNQKDNNSAEITKLQGEVDRLKGGEISALKTKQNHNPSPDISEKLRDKERKLWEKEEKLKNKIKENNLPSSNQQNSNLPIYVGISIGVVGIIICLIIVLIVSKKKKNSIVYTHSKQLAREKTHRKIQIKKL